MRFLIHWSQVRILPGVPIERRGLQRWPALKPCAARQDSSAALPGSRRPVGIGRRCPSQGFALLRYLRLPSRAALGCCRYLLLSMSRRCESCRACQCFLRQKHENSAVFVVGLAQHQPSSTRRNRTGQDQSGHGPGQQRGNSGAEATEVLLNRCSQPEAVLAGSGTSAGLARREDDQRSAPAMGTVGAGVR
jgi:hypothetical protein